MPATCSFACSTGCSRNGSTRASACPASGGRARVRHREVGRQPRSREAPGDHAAAPDTATSSPSRLRPSSCASIAERPRRVERRRAARRAPRRRDRDALDDPALRRALGRVAGAQVGGGRATWSCRPRRRGRSRRRAPRRAAACRVRSVGRQLERVGLGRRLVGLRDRLDRQLRDVARRLIVKRRSNGSSAIAQRRRSRP